MPNMLENFGIDFFYEKEESMMGLLGWALSEGKVVTGYHGLPYVYKSAGDIDFWLTSEKNEEGKFEFDRVHSHCAGQTVWELTLSGINITPEGQSNQDKLVMAIPNTGDGGFLPIHLMPADVLPSFVEGDKIKAQVVALPLEIKYYADEKEFSKTETVKSENGKNWGIAVGSLLPMCFLGNHSIDKKKEEEDYTSDSYVHFAAKVTKIHNGIFQTGEEKHKAFIICHAETNYGEVDFIHSYQQVREDMRDNIRVGSIISGVCMLSGDVAIYEYGDGIVRNFDNNLRLIRNTIVNGEVERIWRVLDENVMYDTDTSSETFTGREKVIEKFKRVEKGRTDRYIAHIATIVQTDDQDMDYPAGTRCITLAVGQPDNYESIMFIDVNKEGYITKIKVSTDSRYHFTIDRPESGKKLAEDIKLPESVLDSVVSRAKFHGLIDREMDKEQICENITQYNTYENNVCRMLEALQENPQENALVALENIMGYLFAKAIEFTVNSNESEVQMKSRLTANYSPTDALNGLITSTFCPEKHKKLEKAMELGKQFFKDVTFFMQLNEIDESKFADVYTQAAIAVQKIGELYSVHCFDEE